MNYKKGIGFVLILLGMISLSYALDLNNISFTNEEFLASSITDSVVLQINSTHIAVGYILGGVTFINFCEIDGTNCDTPLNIRGASGAVSIDMFLDTTNNKIIFVDSTNTNGVYRIINLDLTTGPLRTYNGASTNFVSAVQTNSTHFAIGFQDTGASSNAKIIICKLDGSSCGSETTVRTGTNTFIKIIKNSNNIINYLTVESSLLLHYEFNITGTQISGAKVINAGASAYVDMIEGTDTKLKIIFQDTGDSSKGKLISCNLNGASCGSEIDYNGGAGTSFNTLVEIDEKIFIQFRDDGDSNKGKSVNLNLTGGDLSSESTFETNAVQFLSNIFTTDDTLFISYHDSTNTNGEFAISESLAPAPIVTINTPVNGAFFNTTSIDLNVSTDLITNLTFILNGGSETFICNNCNSSTNITFIAVEGVNNLTVISNFTGILTNATSTFTVDTINPLLTVNLPSEFNSYSGFNFSSFINFSDINLDTCIVTVSDESSTICTNQSYTFITNGNKTINVTVTDLAGNTNSSLNNIMLINPIQLFNFQLSNGTTITDFTFGGLNFSTQANISTFNSVIIIGNNTLLFQKLGFASTNVSFVINSTSELNLTTNITQSVIVIRIFNRETLALLTGLTTITLQATTGFNGSTTTGLLNITNINFINEQYQILAEHAGFSSETVFFNYNNQEILNIDIFMLNSSSPDAGQIEIIVKNSLSQFVESAICSALEWRPSESAFVSVAQGLTNVNGENLLNIELNTKIYQFSCTKQSFTTVTNAQIIQVDLSTLTIILNDVILVPTTLFPNLFTSLTNTTINATHQLITYTFTDSDGLTTEGCLQTFLVNGNRQTFDSETCVSSSSGSILVIVNNNQTSDVLLKGVLTTPSVIDYVTDSITIKGTGDISFQLAKIGMDVLIPTIFILLGLGLGILLSDINVAVILMAVGGWGAVAFVPTVLSAGIAMFITVIVALMIYGGFTRK